MAHDPALAELGPVEQPTFSWEGPPSGPTSKLEGNGGAFAPGDPIEIWREKIVGSNNLRPVSFLARGIELSRAVAHITVPGVGLGTGFLIADDLLLTNNHVIGSETAAQDAVIRFNYEDSLDGTPLPVEEVGCQPADGFYTSPYTAGVEPGKLDFTIVRLSEPMGARWGTIRLSDVAVEPPADVVVIQHPAGEKKQIAIADNELVLADDLKIQYLTDTLPGSSGAPVFNDRWQLIGLHHAGGFYVQPGDPQGHLRNEGVRIKAVLAEMPDWAHDAVGE